jgi:hypothetical protein
VAQANINYGTLPNDKTGDSLRTAMIKVQNNFTELYTTAPISNSVNIGNTTSNVTVNSTTVFIGNSGTYSIANSSSIITNIGYHSQVLNSGANNLVIGTTNSTSILVYTNGITSANQRAIVAANGNVGIGNGAPNELLTVGGTLSANQIIVGNGSVNFTINSTFIPATANYALSANSANNTSFVGSVSAANVVSNAQLSSNLSNYQTTVGLNANIASYLPTYTGVVNGSSHTVSSSFIANSTGVYHTGTVNSASHTVGSSTIANSTGVYTGVVNGSSITVGSSLIGNSTGVYHTGTVNAASHTVGTSTIANSTGVYTGVVNGSSITVGSSTIANSTGVYTGVVNGSSITVGSSLVGNNTGFYHTGIINAASHTVGTSTIANSTGVYTGVVNGSSITVGSSFQANSTGVTANSLTVSTNTATIGSSVYVASNGNIGLGATPGSYKLDVNGDAIVRGTQGFDANSETATLYIGNYDSYIKAVYDGGLDFYQGNNRVARFSAQSSASVGMFQFNSGYGSAANAYGVRAWINFYNNAVRNSGNMAGISKQSTGYFIVYIDTDMPDASYAAVANYSNRNENTGDQNDGQAMCWDYQTSYFRVTVSKGDGGIVEPSYVCSVIVAR